MNKELINHMARRICREEGHDPDRMYQQHPGSKSYKGWEWYIDTAEIAIQAIEEAGYTIVPARPKAGCVNEKISMEKKENIKKSDPPGSADTYVFLLPEPPETSE